MNILKKQIILITFLVLITGCTTAKKAYEVDPAYVSSSAYENRSCKELLILAEEIKQQTPTLERRVNETRKKDKVKEQVGLWLFWPSYFFMEGNAEEQTDLALARGNLNAIRTAALKNECNTQEAIQITTQITAVKEPKKKTVTNNLKNKPKFMSNEDLNNYLEELYKAKIDLDAIKQIEKLYDRGVISKRVYLNETEKILDQANVEMLEELESLLDKGLISKSSYKNEKEKILVKGKENSPLD